MDENQQKQDRTCAWKRGTAGATAKLQEAEVKKLGSTKAKDNAQKR